MEEHAAYHALALTLEGDYGKLKKEKDTHGSWSAAWLAKRAGGTDSLPLLETMRNDGIALVLKEDSAYPPLLREIPHPPHALYIKGGFAPEGKTALAIVGTRKATESGRELARRISSKVAAAGAVIVSGLAFGIDAAAHEGALDAGGVTWAVLANGLDRVYPASHARLAARILDAGGILVSEYPPGSPVYTWRFLERNRIVSGLSRAVFVVEAPRRSGAMATARFAVDQNRDVLAAPGPAMHPNYAGCHALIRAGAALVTTPEEVLEALGLAPETSPALGFEDPAEQAILAVLAGADSPMQIDEIIQAATLSASEANRALTMLVLRGIAEEENGTYIIA